MWIWLALCSRTRQIVAYATGDRSARTAFKLYQRIPPSYRQCMSFSDEWDAYRLIFDPSQHTQVGKGTGLTNYVERHNGVMRQRIGRLARKTLRYSRCEEMHDAVIKLWIIEHNLMCKKQASLSVFS